ncbi:Ig-like domain-containing protein [Hydrocarboniclastica marina]|uniref:SbsA Ig-like domain-containing protein n=1 Tax=Hydrocarboniclastica marina TaxID=2259620 RepID=A0A4P7XJY6_9ALTE|nr:Ig-like domain-containing protein [Hydrocarboniclastica marina]QCF27486.1 hypothetical protein soil367_17000 [Hydrocarboniclastica marina]
MNYNHIVRLGSVCVLSAILLVGCNDSSSGGSVSSPTAGGDSSGDSSGSGENTPDTTGPSVVQTTPAADETGVSRTIALTAEFDEDVLGTSVSNSTVLLEEVAGSAVAGTVTFDGAANIATLEPDARLTLLTEYEASVTTEVADLLGNPMASAHTWRFTTEDGAWGEAQLLEMSDIGRAADPQIATSADGTAMAVWRQHDGTYYSIYASRYVAGSGWQAVELLETSNLANVFGAQVAVDGAGNALAVWQQSDGSTTSIYANRYTADSGWQGAELIETGSTTAEHPQIAFGADGSAMAVWRQDDGSRRVIHANRYVAGSGWQGDEPIETNGNHASVPQVAVDIDGNALAVWAQWDGSRNNIYANRYVAGNGWQVSQLIETGNGAANDPQIAFDNDGNALAVWVQNDGTYDNVHFNRYVAGTGWQTDEPIEAGNAGNASFPQIAIDDAGNALAVWHKRDGVQSDIVASLYVAGGWQGAEPIETGNGGAISPQVAFDSKGNALAVWQQNAGVTDHIYANRYVAGAGWQVAELIETDDAGAASSPQIAIGMDGSALAVWHQHDGARTNIYVNQLK